MGLHAREDEGLRLYLDRISQFPPLEREQELRLARRWKRRRDPAVSHVLVESHLRFVVKVANRYRGYGLKVEDLIEEGNLGLLEAVRRFDPNRGLRFMTYAAYWVRAYILSHVLKQSSLVGVGTGPIQSRLFFRLGRERARIISALGGTADESEVTEILARRFRTSPERIRNMTGRLESRDLSLNMAAYRDSEVTGMDLLADDEAEGTEERTARLERSREIRSRLGRIQAELSQRERQILTHRLMTDEPLTLAELGRTLRLSRERVRQLEERLKMKLRVVLSDLDAGALAGG
jgi:RNA polymerase sigma-32 factor